MPRALTCPGCHTVYRLPDSPAGNAPRLRCKKCDRVLTAGGQTRRPAPRPESSSPALLLVAILVPLGLLLLGGTALGVYFLFFNQGPAPEPVVQTDTKKPAGKEKAERPPQIPKDLG